jgi:8-oxo-dGTP pyrophosphatase MutT (NUDIX family)
MNELARVLKRIQEMDEPGFPFPAIEALGARASVLALFSGESFQNSEILLLKRSSTVLTHPDQVAFPGGGVEDRDLGSLVETALRETFEEVGLSREGIHPFGILPGLPTVTGGVFVSPVLALATPSVRGSPIIPDPSEVAHADWVRIQDLISSRKEEERMVRGIKMSLPEFQWKGERMWGMTALIFDLILRRYARIGE